MKEVRAIFIKYIKYLQTSVLKNDVFKSWTLLGLPGKHQATLDEMHVLMQRFPKVVTDMNALKSKSLEHQATTRDEFLAYFDENDNLMAIYDIWHQISKKIDLYSCQPRFKHLAEFANFQLLISNRNSYCESTFNTIRKICTNGYYNVMVTQGHVSTSVFTGITSTRNNPLGILIPKISIFVKKKLACYE